MLTESELEAGLKLCESATPGPWYRTTFIYSDPHMDDHEEGKACWTVGPDAKDENWTTDASCDGYGMLKKDADFCAAARTLLPKALKDLKHILDNNWEWEIKFWSNEAKEYSEWCDKLQVECDGLRAENGRLRQAIEENKDGLAIKRQMISYELEINVLRAENEKLQAELHLAQLAPDGVRDEYVDELDKLRAENEQEHALNPEELEAALQLCEAAMSQWTRDRDELFELRKKWEQFTEARSNIETFIIEVEKLRAENAKLWRVKEAAEKIADERYVTHEGLIAALNAWRDKP